MELNAIEKALLVLTNFSDGNNPIGTIELADRLHLNKTTVSRIMNTLKRHEFLEQDPRTRQYRLGPMVARLGKAIIQALDGQITLIAQPYCDQLRDQVGETVHFEMMSGNHIYLAYAARGPNPVSVAIDVGGVVYPNVHVGADTIAAYANFRHADRRSNGARPIYSADSAIDASRRQATHAEFSEKGLSIDDGEFDENIYAIRAPVFNHNGRAAAGVVVVAPHMRKQDLEKPHVTSALKETAALISDRLLCHKEYQEMCNLQVVNYDQ